MSLFTNSIRRANPIVHTTGITVVAGSSVTFSAAPFSQEMSSDRFILEIDQEIPFGVTDGTQLTVTPAEGSPTTYVMYDRYGNYARADRLLSAINYRKMGLLNYNGCNPYQFQAVLGIDPARINILCCLPPSNYSTTTAS